MSGQRKHFEPCETITQPTSSFQHHLSFPLLLFSKCLAQKHTTFQQSPSVSDLFSLSLSFFWVSLPIVGCLSQTNVISSTQIDGWVDKWIGM